MLEEGGVDSNHTISKRRKQALESLREKPSSSTATATATNEEPSSSYNDNTEALSNDDAEQPTESLLERAEKMQKVSEAERAEQQRQDEEARILREASKVQTNALVSAKETAQGTSYSEPMPTSWKPPRYILQQGPEAWQKIRDDLLMQVQGADIPPPLSRFVDMKLPRPILRVLNDRGITTPTPIQMQGIPVALSGRDMIGIAFTGSGKTLTFTLPLLLAGLEEELRMPLVAGEGPVGIVLAPSRELARQTFDQVQAFEKALSSDFPPLRSQLLIGGESSKTQVQVLQKQGLHSVVATPGRLRDLLKRRELHLQVCRFVCLDEADRMLDLGFDEEVADIMNFFPRQRQTLLFSATFPRKFQDFARQTLVQPIVVNVGRAGAANQNVTQEVELVQEEEKMVHILSCLQKTAPPVIIFSERKQVVDDIHEYLLLKGVEAVSIHGSKDQTERNEAIQLFKEGQKDVLIATDIAAKGLDFPDIQHVINVDMPAEIENYVHRIGRTGRRGKSGVATTFINQSCDQTTLLDLKALLVEAKQKVPPVLAALEDPREKHSGAGCSFCGGLGHTIVDCPKIDKDARRVAGNQRDVLAGGGGDW